MFVYACIRISARASMCVCVCVCLILGEREEESVNNIVIEFVALNNCGLYM